MRPSRQRRFGLACVTLVAACSGKPAGEAVVVVRRDAAIAIGADAGVAIEVPARPLGLADLAAWGWRKRAGQSAMREARDAEGREDWAATAAACQRVLAADPTHLEASWLLAIADAKLGKLDELLAPLQVAAAGDLGKWGLASLEHPALAGFLATPLGAAWRRRVEADRAAYTAIVARALVVLAGGDLYAYDPAGTRWLRLTRTSGAVVSGLRVAGGDWIAYVARRRSKATGPARPGDAAGTVPPAPPAAPIPPAVDVPLGVGVIDLRTAKPYLPLDVGAQPIAVGSGPLPGPNGGPGAWIGRSPPHPVWLWADPGPHLVALPKHAKRAPGPWLAVAAGVPVLHALPVRDVVADWDDRGLASAMRLVRTNRVVAVAGQVVGDSVVWSRDRAAVAFVAEIADDCTPGTATAAVYVADAGTGTPRELARAVTGGLAIEWLADGRVAIAGDDGIQIVDLASESRLPLAGATELLTPRHRLACGLPDVATPGELPEDDTSEP